MPMTMGGHPYVPGEVASNPYSQIAHYTAGLGTVSLEYFTVSLWHRWITEPAIDSGYAPILYIRGRSGASIAWIRLDGGSGNAGTWGMRPKSVGLQTWNGSYSAGVNTGTDDIVEGQWYHYAIVADGANGTKAYQDGVEVLSNTNSLIGIGDIELIYAGGQYSTQAAEGQIAHVKLWDAALTQAEIASEMATGEPFRLSNIKCWRPHLDDTSDNLGILGYNTVSIGTFGGSVPVAWHRQNALYDLSVGDDTGGDGPAGAGTVYTDYIGSGTLDTSADYATMSTWFAASGSGNVTYVNGDEVRAIFQTSADGHFGPHAWGGTQIAGGLYSNGICWTEDKDITITCSSTNPTGSGTPDGYLTTGGSRFSFQNASSTKTWNFKGLDFIWPDGDNFRFNINTYLASGATSPRTPVNFDRCKFLSPDLDYFFQLGNENVLSGIIECNFTNCLILPNLQFFRFAGNNNPNAAIANLVGCTLQSSSNVGWFSNSNSPSCSFEVHMSGCVVDIGIDPDDLNGWNGVVQYSRGGYTSGTATDYITNEPQSIVDGWANTQTNVSAAVSSVYGVAPAAGQVAFAGVTKAAGNPFDAFTRDLRLWDSTNNVAIEHVTTVTLPSPDLAGQYRGLSPFNAGAFEGLFVPSSEVVLNLLTTQVNLY